MALTKRTIWATLLVAGTATSVFSAQSNSLNWQKAGGFRTATLSVPGSGKTGFRILPVGVTPKEATIAAMESMPLGGLADTSLRDGYQSMINGVASSSSSAKTNAQAADVVLQTLQAQRESLSFRPQPL